MGRKKERKSKRERGGGGCISMYACLMVEVVRVLIKLTHSVIHFSLARSRTQVVKVGSETALNNTQTISFVDLVPSLSLFMVCFSSYDTAETLYSTDTTKSPCQFLIRCK